MVVRVLNHVITTIPVPLVITTALVPLITTTVPAPLIITTVLVPLVIALVPTHITRMQFTAVCKLISNLNFSLYWIRA